LNILNLEKGGKTNITRGESKAFAEAREKTFSEVLQK